MRCCRPISQHHRAVGDVAREARAEAQVGLLDVRLGRQRLHLAPGDARDRLRTPTHLHVHVHVHTRSLSNSLTNTHSRTSTSTVLGYYILYEYVSEAQVNRLTAVLVRERACETRPEGGLAAHSCSRCRIPSRSRGSGRRARLPPRFAFACSFARRTPRHSRRSRRSRPLVAVALVARLPVQCAAPRLPAAVASRSPQSSRFESTADSSVSIESNAELRLLAASSPSASPSAPVPILYFSQRR